jgi:tryptophan synthase beta subunit
MQDDDGQVIGTHSVSAGLDYPGVGAEHSYLKDLGRAEYVAVTDEEALDALQWVAHREGLICALETAHAFAALKTPGLFKPGERVIVNMSGRGDKDMVTVAGLLKL